MNTTIAEPASIYVQVKLPEELAQKLRVASALSRDTHAKIVQVALEQYFKKHPVELPPQEARRA